MQGFSDAFSENAAKMQISISEQQMQRFELYADTLVEWNQKMNLTAITDPQGIAVKHFLDSAALLQHVEVTEGSSIIDVGTGAGFPSVPIKLLRPDLRITLLDSLRKRIGFLDALCAKLDVQAYTLHARAEEAGKKTALREQFDVATARAVAHLRELSEYCLPFVRPGGCFLAMKGQEVEQELDEARNAIGMLGGRVQKVQKYTLPDGSGRAVVVIQKISQTPSNFPRMPAKIAKKPL